MRLSFQPTRTSISILWKVLFLSAVFPASAQGGPPASGAEPLGLNRAYELVLKQSEADRIQAEEWQIVEARYKQSVAGFYPELGLFARRVWTGTTGGKDNTNTGAASGSGATAGGAASGSTGSSSTTGTEGLVAGVAVRWPIFTGFRTLAESRALAQERKGAAQARRRFRELLYRDVADVFYQNLLLEKNDEVLREEEKALRGRIGELYTFLNLGRARQGELMAARLDLSANLVQRETNRSIWNASRELLAFLTGVPAEQLKLRDDSTLPAPEALETYLAKTGERADVLAATRGMRAQQERVKVARGGHFPNVTLDGEAALYREPRAANDYRVSLAITLPLFQGGAASARSDEARAGFRKSELELERVRRTARFETRLAYGDFISALARMVLLKEAERLARSTYYIQVRDYGLGIVTNLEVLDALRRYHQTRRNFVQAEIDARVHHVRLHVAAGRESP